MMLWRNLKSKIGKVLKNIRLKRVDILIYCSFFILFFTTLSLNIYAGFYLLAVLMIILAITMARHGD